MKKADELSSPTSCMNSAKDDEWVFVLKSTDRHAPATVEFWACLRLMEVLRREQTDATPIDIEKRMAKIEEAQACAQHMREWRLRNHTDPGQPMSFHEAVASAGEMLLRKNGVCEVAFVTVETARDEEQHFAERSERAWVQLTMLYDGEEAPTRGMPAPTLYEALAVNPYTGPLGPKP